MHRSFRHIVALAALFLLVLPLARAQLTIEIVGGAGTAVPIVPFDGEPAGPTSISYIVGQDLTRSGLFKLVDPSGVAPRPARIEDVQAATWRAKGADAVVVGSARPLADGRVIAGFAGVPPQRAPGGTLSFTLAVAAICAPSPMVT